MGEKREIEKRNKAVNSLCFLVDTLLNSLDYDNALLYISKRKKIRDFSHTKLRTQCLQRFFGYCLGGSSFILVDWLVSGKCDGLTVITERKKRLRTQH